MHEASLVASAVKAAAEAARKQGGGRVISVILRVGVLSGLSPEIVREHFMEAARGTSVEGALVEVLEDEEITAGAQELTLESIEVEV